MSVVSRPDAGHTPNGRTSVPHARAPRSRVLELDGLRALAVLAVIAFHAAPSVVPGGGAVGVLAFFVLSGWLITVVLLAERSRTGEVHLCRFWARRLLRLVPPMAVALIVTPLVHGAPDDGRVSSLAGVLAGMSYLTNLAMFAEPHLVPVVTHHLWSLATEEQFYLGWPFLLRVLVRPSRTIRPVVKSLAAVLAAVAVGFASTAIGNPDHPAYYLPTIWAQALVIGGVGAQLLCLTSPPPGVAAALASTAVAVTCAALLAVATVGDLQGAMVPVLSVTTLALVVHVGTNPHSRLSALLRTRLLVAVGQRSYSLYLVHPLLLVGCREAWGGSSVVVGGAVLASFGAAWLLYALVERPALRWKDRFAPVPDPGQRCAARSR